MQWEGKIGPAFIVCLGIALLQGMAWLEDGKSKLSERVAIIETQMQTLTRFATRIENKIDKANSTIP